KEVKYIHYQDSPQNYGNSLMQEAIDPHPQFLQHGSP
ncbi:unnamed protein product, partial [marine sediment metagenome]